MHYLHLRMDSHAQKEIREYADMIYNLVEPLCPITMKAFMDFRVNSVQFSGPELRVLSRYLTSPSIDIPSSGELSKGEEREFRDKVQTILKNDSQD